MSLHSKYVSAEKTSSFDQFFMFVDDPKMFIQFEMNEIFKFLRRY